MSDGANNQPTGKDAGDALKERTKAIGKVQTYDPFTATWRDATKEEAAEHVASPTVSPPAEDAS
jgi:hypothetical protein